MASLRYPKWIPELSSYVIVFFLIIGFYIPKNLGAMNMKVAVIGLGKASLPLAAVIAESDMDVIGIDATSISVLP